MKLCRICATIILTISFPVVADVFTDMHNDIHGPGSWVEHGLIAAALTQAFKGTEYGDYVAAGVCAGFLIREATQRGGAFNDIDSNMDWAVPCAVAGGVAVSPYGLMFWKAW